MVRAAIIGAFCVFAAPVDACRLALVLALDVSSSVDDAEDQLQRGGLAAALLSQPVQDAFFISPEPVALHIFEWSGRGHQTDLVGWTIIEAPDDLAAIASHLTNSMRSASGLPTAVGHALAYASITLQKAPDCLFQTIDIAGDGANNEGFGPSSVYATFPFEGVTVNGLVITNADMNAQAYYTDQVMRGPLAFVEIARYYTDFADEMQRKLIRELSSQVMGRLSAQHLEQG